MPGVPGLSIVVGGEDSARLHAALSVAAAWAALDRPARIFLQSEAVVLLRAAPVGEDETLTLEGIPTLAELLKESLALGVSVTACQTGLAFAGLSAQDLPAGVETSGLVDFLSVSGPDDQVVMA